MRILQIAPQVPFPLSDGGKVGIFNITKSLAERGHELTLAAFDRDAHAGRGPLETFCNLVTFPHSTGNSPGGAFMNLFSKYPYNISKYKSGGFLKLVLDLAQRIRPDVVHVDHLHMAEYGVALKTRLGLPIVLREHNVETMIMSRYALHAPNPLLRWYAGIQSARVRRYETLMTGLFDCCCPITSDDACHLKEMNPQVRVRVVPGGVDPAYFDKSGGGEPIPDSIVFFGGFDWIPNQDALLWFLREVFPSVRKERPAARLYVVGKNVPPEIARLAGEHCIFRGYVDHLRNEIQQYVVSIAPFRIGGGMRLKIIESFAMGIPVVSTRVGCEGIDAIPGEHLLLGDTPGDFSRQVVSILADPQLRSTLTRRAYDLASRGYRWETVAKLLEDVYRDVAPAAPSERKGPLRA